MPQACRGKWELKMSRKRLLLLPQTHVPTDYLPFVLCMYARYCFYACKRPWQQHTWLWTGARLPNSHGTWPARTSSTCKQGSLLHTHIAYPTLGQNNFLLTPMGFESSLCMRKTTLKWYSEPTKVHWKHTSTPFKRYISVLGMYRAVPLRQKHAVLSQNICTIQIL